MGAVVALGQAEPQRQEARDAAGRQHPEDRPPAEADQQIAAEQRCQHRRRAHHEHQGGVDARRVVGLEQVAHHGAGDHHAGAGADRLQEAQRRQGPRPSAPGRSRLRSPRTGSAGIEGRFAAEPVGDRAVAGLPSAKPRKKLANVNCARGASAARLRAIVGIAGRIHVDGERRERGQRAQDHHQLGAMVAHAVSVPFGQPERKRPDRSIRPPGPRVRFCAGSAPTVGQIGPDFNLARASRQATATGYRR